MFLLSSLEDISDPPGRIEKALDTCFGGAYVPAAVSRHPSRQQQP